MSDATVYYVAQVSYTLGYALLFLVFGLVWLKVFFRGSLRLGETRVWPALSLGALGFLLTMKIQPPIQAWLNAKAGNLGWSVWVVGGLLTLTSGVVQETLKAAGMTMVRFSSAGEVNHKSLGLALGLGFGVWEAWQIVAWPLGSSRLWSPIAVMERFSAIGLHIALAALIAYGLSVRRPLRFVALAALIHGIANFSVVLYHQWILNYWTLEVYVLGAAFASMILARLLWKNERP